MDNTEGKREQDGVTLDDGKGLYTSDGLIDGLIVDCNRLTQCMASGQYVQYCNTVVQMVQKLGALREGIRKEHEDRDKAIQELQALCDDLQEQITGLPAGDDVPAISEEALP